MGIDIDKFWFLLLFIFDYACGTCIDGMKGYGAEIEQLKEAVKAIVENHKRTTEYGITFKNLIKKTILGCRIKEEHLPLQKKNKPFIYGCSIRCFKTFSICHPIKRRKKGEQGLSLSKIFLVSKLIYFTRLSTNTKFYESDENLRGYISLHKGRIINTVNSIY